MGFSNQPRFHGLHVFSRINCYLPGENCRTILSVFSIVICKFEIIYIRSSFNFMVRFSSNLLNFCENWNRHENTKFFRYTLTDWCSRGPSPLDSILLEIRKANFLKYVSAYVKIKTKTILNRKKKVITKLEL